MVRNYKAQLTKTALLKKNSKRANRIKRNLLQVLKKQGFQFFHKLKSFSQKAKKLLWLSLFLLSSPSAKNKFFTESRNFQKQLTLLELRIDILLFRCNFLPDIKQSYLFFKLGIIKKNDRRVNRVVYCRLLDKIQFKVSILFKSSFLVWYRLKTFFWAFNRSSKTRGFTRRRRSFFEKDFRALSIIVLKNPALKDLQHNSGSFLPGHSKKVLSTKLKYLYQFF